MRRPCPRKGAAPRRSPLCFFFSADTRKLLYFDARTNTHRNIETRHGTKHRRNTSGQGGSRPPAIYTSASAHPWTLPISRPSLIPHRKQLHCTLSHNEKTNTYREVRSSPSNECRPTGAAGERWSRLTERDPAFCTFTHKTHIEYNTYREPLPLAGSKKARLGAPCGADPPWHTPHSCPFSGKARPRKQRRLLDLHLYGRRLNEGTYVSKRRHPALEGPIFPRTPSEEHAPPAASASP